MILFENKIFHLQTNNTSYLIRLHDAGFLEQLYYGKRIRQAQGYEALYEKFASGFGNTIATPADSKMTFDNICLEYSYSGTGDYRHLPLTVQMPDHGFGTEFLYESHRIYDGTYDENEMTKMPYAHQAVSIVASSDAQTSDNTNVNNTNANNIPETLDITLKDSVYPVYIHLIYTCFPECDVITRRIKIDNKSETEISITKAMSMMLDLPGRDYDLHTFDGLWAKERHKNVKKLVSGLYVNDSTTGSSSNRHNPFVMLSRDNCTEEMGDCFGFNLIYSGNHYEAADVSEYGKVRIMSGINPFQFSWTLKGGEAFYAPEAVVSYSCKGFNGLSHNMHAFVNENIIPAKWAERERPVLVNNWEATYFDFNEAKILKIAREAKKLGIEMLVLDDGWFGKRSDDTTSLGDWKANEKKLGGSLKKLSDKVNEAGLKFGLWFEPEMISEKSELFEKHPDWAVKAPGRGNYIGRNQFVLNLTMPEVRDYIVEAVGGILSKASIEYVKWDMNRHITDAYSAGLGEKQGEFYHRYILGIYEVMKRITDEFPDVLFEGCSAGGNRFDLGVLSFMPQIWTSDDTDANERTHIQQGTSYGYPLSTMGAHLSDVPNHQTLRDTSLETRFNVAAFGVFGYEIDVTKLTKAEKKAITEQISFYKEHRKLFQTGLFSRLPSDDNHMIWQVTSADKKEAVILFYQRIGMPGSETDILRAVGLDEEQLYEVSARKQYISIRQFGNLVNQVSPVNITNEGVLQSVVNKVYMLESENESYQAYGDLIMNAGIRLSQQFCGTGYDSGTRVMGDFASRLYVIKSLENQK